MGGRGAQVWGPLCPKLDAYPLRSVLWFARLCRVGSLSGGARGSPYTTVVLTQALKTSSPTAASSPARPWTW